MPPPYSSSRVRAVSNIRFISIFFMMFVHLTLYEAVSPVFDKGLFDQDFSKSVVLILVDGFGLVSAPLLGLISGFFFAANSETNPYFRLLGRRLRTLYVPVVTWSAVAALASLLTGLITADWIEMSNRIEQYDLNTLFGITSTPINGPLHFMVDLLKCILISPILIFLLKRRYYLQYYILVAVAAAFLLSFSSSHDYTRGFNLDNALPRIDLFLFFSVGLYIRRRWSDDVMSTLARFSFSSSGARLALFVVFILAAGHWRWLDSLENNKMGWSAFALRMFTRVSGCLFILSFLPWIRSLAERGLYVEDRLTFYLFCTHIIVFRLGQSALGMLTGWNPSAHNQVIAWCILPLIAFAVAAALYSLEGMLRSARAQGVSNGPTI